MTVVTFFPIVFIEMSGMPHLHVEGLVALPLCDLWPQISWDREVLLLDQGLVLVAGEAPSVPLGSLGPQTRLPLVVNGPTVVIMYDLFKIA